ncbi:ABC-type tungstate transport system, permease component [Paramagnetospirillum caucaseum]|uniref:ABC-type tungstate transport system, permease component n=1 Tax=Paramagnetospirillum caucaseum TaxID=1244869 RepID=M3AAJ3_9PROT|nr:substrate-binding domain-containing protein [Paramagnetospirillum caucaseum]EME69514.1 ABC-type tungstate transport system, permease component [Paramagnetospirillum caucaseum]
MKRLLLAVLAVFSLAAAPAGAEDRFITLASTTSTEQSGLFGHLLPLFKAETGIEVRVVAVGTGQALKLGERGDADALLVHDRAGEDKFVAEGFGLDRRDVMYNDFVVVGPSADPAGVKGGKDAAEAFKKIAAAKAPFASRGDDSGTHRSELRLWKKAGVDVKAGGEWYRELGSGMGPTLNTAAGMNAYALADRGTWASFKNRQSLAIVVEGDRALFNPYGSILVNPEKHKAVKAADSKAWHLWLSGPKGQAAIAAFKIGGEQLFFGDAR